MNDGPAKNAEQRRGTRKSRDPLRLAGAVLPRLLLFAAALASALAFTEPANAQNAAPQPPPDAPPTRRLTLHSAVEPRPALKYELLPSLLDRRPGNAAVLYNKIGLMFRGGAEFSEQMNKVSEWIESDLPLDKFPREEARVVVDRWRHVLDDLELASRCEQCDWELPLQEREFISLLLPEIQEAREYARLLSLKARLQIVEGDFDGAVRTLRTGYALGRHVAKSPTLISTLVGVATCAQMNARIEELASQPGAPSLYWALTALPRPLVDFRLGIEAEKASLLLTFPELRDLGGKRRSPEDWRRLFDKFGDDLVRVGAIERRPAGRLLLTGMAIKGYPAAKRRLIELGRSPEEVEAMPVAQAVLLYSLDAYEEARDAMLKWTSVPYWEAAPQSAKVEQEIAAAYRTKEILPFNVFLTPGNAFIAASARSERAIAMLRVIEALRLHAGSHEGRLPKQLSEITDAPIPQDAITGGPFIYRAEGDAATLEAPLPPGMDQTHYGMRYEIEFVR
ncbi:MAG TPA: hypothetical protein VGN42_25760 [Pirellulales bacterium]|jgi:hypothetical protein|nr:hypothetical protein [Pirellulales bacterium]